jgi:hypothetical protein
VAGLEKYGNAFITQMGGRPTFVALFCMHLSKVEVLQVAVKALLVYASDQLGEGMEKKTKVSVSMKGLDVLVTLEVSIRSE